VKGKEDSPFAEKVEKGPLPKVRGNNSADSYRTKLGKGKVRRIPKIGGVSIVFES